MTNNDIKIGRSILKKLVANYTRESGVRGFDKTIAKVIRDRAKSIALEEEFETSCLFVKNKSMMHFKKLMKNIKKVG